MKHSRLCLAALVLLACARTADAQEGTPPIRLTPLDEQNFLAAAPGDLRIAGSPDRYDIVLPTDVLFDFDESALRPEAEPLLRKVVAHLRANGSDQVHVRGHTDAKGTEQHNFVLSQKRAGAVCERLKRDLQAAIMCIGRGEEEPLVAETNADGSDNPAQRQLNRRVTVSVVRYPDAGAMLDAAKKNADAALRTLDESAEPAR